MAYLPLSLSVGSLIFSHSCSPVTPHCTLSECETLLSLNGHKWVDVKGTTVQTHTEEEKLLQLHTTVPADIQKKQPANSISVGSRCKRHCGNYLVCVTFRVADCNARRGAKRISIFTLGEPDSLWPFVLSECRALKRCSREHVAVMHR